MRFTIAILIVSAVAFLSACEQQASKPAAPASAPTVAPPVATPPVAAAPAAAYPLAVCVVSDHKLGEMGEPVVVMHEGREVRLCCKDCIEGFKAEPAKYIAKLDAAAKAKAAPDAGATSPNQTH